MRRQLPCCQALSEALTIRASDWLALDQEETSRSLIQSLIEQEDETQLRPLLMQVITECTIASAMQCPESDSDQSAMLQNLEFGTAGLRAKMAPGFARMNSVTVQLTSQGLCRYLQKLEPDRLRAGVVIGEPSSAQHEATVHLLVPRSSHEPRFLPPARL